MSKWTAATAVPAIVVAATIALAPPLGALGVAGLVLLASLIFANPQRSAILLGFLVGAVPKAGVRLGEFPVPFMLFGLAIALTVLHLLNGRPRLSSRLLLPLLLLIIWTGGRLHTLRAADASLAEQVTLVAWALLPALIVAASVSERRHMPALRQARWARALEGGVIVASLFSPVQALFGLSQTTVPGITLAWGDSYETKHIHIAQHTADAFSKVPSTYHNGNVLGAVTGFFLLTAWIRILRGSRTRWDKVLLLSTALASGLSASRTVFIGVTVAAVVALMIHGNLRQRVRLVVLAMVLGFVAVTLQPGLADRFSPESVTDTQAAGRTEAWADTIDQVGFGGLAVGTTYWVDGKGNPTEGLVGAGNRLGLIGVGLLALIIWRSTQRSPEWRIPLIVVAVSFVLDSSYVVFPTLFVPFARMWAPMWVAKSRREARHDSPPPPGAERHDGVREAGLQAGGE